MPMCLPRISRRQFVTAAVAAGGLAVSGRSSGDEPLGGESAVAIKEDRTVVDFSVNSKLFAVYNYHSDHAAIYRPFFYPVMGPNDQPITQQGEFPGSLRGHYWHRSLFIAHQRVNGISFWEERKADCGRIVHTGFDEMNSGPEGPLVERLAWQNVQGQDLLHEVRTIRVAAAPTEYRYLDISVSLEAAGRSVEFGATPYNLLACRVINAMCLVAQKEKYTRQFGSLVNFAPLDMGGQILNSEGQENEACRGARAKWCDFSGPLGDGTWGGVALFDHPGNPRHPTPWHNWNNMTIMASFTYHEPFTLVEGKPLQLAYRVAVHAGDAHQANIPERWQEYAQTNI